MRVIGKMPYKPAEIIEIGNDLEALQDYVGGKIETFSFASNACVICNEEGLIKDLPFNLKFLGNVFYGPILIVGVKDDEFTDCPVPGFILDNINRNK